MGYRYLVAAVFRAHPAVQRLLAYENSDDTTYWTREDGEAYAELMQHIVVYGGQLCETPICSLSRGSSLYFIVYYLGGKNYGENEMRNSYSPGDKRRLEKRLGRRYEN